ncbi:MAG: hypothetical protein ABSC23_03885 [Bryobacteraceae bacterium]|jgi:hypothetical protein
MRSAAKYVLGLALLCVFLCFVPAHGQFPVVLTQAVTLTPQLDVFQEQGQQYTLTHSPAANTDPMVFVNGLLMLKGTDYTLCGSALTFTGQEIGERPIIQVHYWVVLSAPSGAALVIPQ